MSATTDYARLTQLLRDASLKRTPTRVAALRALLAARKPVNAADLLTRLPEGTDTVTVYRTLAAFVEAGLARRLSGVDAAALYEAAIDTRGHVQSHAHFTCDACGTTRCLPDNLAITRLPEQLGLKGAFQVERTDVTIHGKCPDCRMK